MANKLVQLNGLNDNIFPRIRYKDITVSYTANAHQSFTLDVTPIMVCPIYTADLYYLIHQDGAIYAFAMYVDSTSIAVEGKRTVTTPRELKFRIFY